MSHGHLEGEEFSIERGVVTAALGNTWSHCVNTRLLLQFMQDGKRLVREMETDIHVYIQPCYYVM